MVHCLYSIILGVVNTINLKHHLGKEDAHHVFFLEIIVHPVGKLHPFGLVVVSEEWFDSLLVGPKLEVILKELDECSAPKCKKPKSLFTKCSLLDNRGRRETSDDLCTLAKYHFSAGQTSSVNMEDFPHLGLLGDRQSVLQTLASEVDGGEDGTKKLVFSLWSGDLKEQILDMAKRKQLDQTTVLLSAVVSIPFYHEICEKYAEYLEGKEDFFGASSMLLAANKVLEAIALLERHGYFRDAIALAKLRLPPSSPVIPDLLAKWCDKLIVENNYPMAARCQVGMGSMEEALVILSRCTDHHSRKAAAVIAAMLGRGEVAQSYGLQVIEDALLHLDWDLAMDVIQEIPSLNWWKTMIEVHRKIFSTGEEFLKLDNMGPMFSSLLEHARKERTSLQESLKTCMDLEWSIPDLYSEDTLTLLPQMKEYTEITKVQKGFKKLCLQAICKLTVAILMESTENIVHCFKLLLDDSKMKEGSDPLLQMAMVTSMAFALTHLCKGKIAIEGCSKYVHLGLTYGAATYLKWLKGQEASLEEDSVDRICEVLNVQSVDDLTGIEHLEYLLLTYEHLFAFITSVDFEEQLRVQACQVLKSFLKKDPLSDDERKYLEIKWVQFSSTIE
ncbi:unnamed protein product [Darwinula stevensoni]|uniref:Gem-associated protein 5 TPR domain-containing protein n=1 Tax=Darwinula stevensoni TaxID=69355 RepID=A0A7R9A9X5_9CRUS|nr:unnamed protein product [Darwinula stevensoni]CAG0897885.1 unnamed protein product [Darwinula stevensoni]